MSEYLSGLVELDAIRVLEGMFPGVKVMLAPDSVSLAGDRLMTVRAAYFPVQGRRGVRAVVDVNVFDKDRSRLMGAARMALDGLEEACNQGKFQGYSSFTVVSLPTLTGNPTDARLLRTCGFSFTLTGHYTL